jgi:hypothetical protein
MCEGVAVVVPIKPVKLTDTVNVWALVSMVTNANPVPGDAFGGLSLRPFRIAE